MLDLQVQDYPWGKSDYRNKVHKKFHAMAYPHNVTDGAALTLDQLAVRIKAALNG